MPDQKNGEHLRVALIIATLYNAATFVFLVTGVVAVKYLSPTIRYPHDHDIRLILAFINPTLALCTGAVLFSELYQARRAGAPVCLPQSSFAYCIAEKVDPKCIAGQPLCC